MFKDRLHYEADKVQLTIAQRIEVERLMREHNVSLSRVIRTLVDKGLKTLHSPTPL